MQPFIEIYEEMKTVYSKIEHDTFSKIQRDHERLRAAALISKEEHDNLAKQFEDEAKHQHYLKAEFKVLENNAIAALINEKVPKVFEILQKYAGKRIGDKTEDKIDSEIKDVTGLRVSFRYSRGISIYFDYPLIHSSSITFYPKYINGVAFQQFDHEGKLNVIKPEFYQLSNYEYIDDIHKYINDKQAKLIEINEKIQELRTEISDYNKDLVSGFNNIDFYRLNSYSYSLI